MKTKFLPLILGAILGASSLVAVPAQADTGDCSIVQTVATCTGSNLDALRNNNAITSVTLDGAPISGDVLATMPSLASITYEGPIDVDLRNATKAPALKNLYVNFQTKETRVKAGTPFTLPTFKGFDGQPFSLEIGDYFDVDGWRDNPPVKQAGFNTFVAPKNTRIRFLDGYYEGKLPHGENSISYAISIGDQWIVNAYEEASWLGSGKLDATFEKDSAYFNAPANATVLPTGARLKVSGTKTSTGYELYTVCTWYRDGKALKVSVPESQDGCSYWLTKADSGKKLTVTAKHYYSKDRNQEYWEPTTDTFSRKVAVQDPIMLKTNSFPMPKVGQKITPKVTGAPSGANLKFQWYADNKLIKGATGSSYTPVVADLDKRITYSVQGVKPGMFSLSFSGYAIHSEKVSNGTFKVVAKPTISGKAVYGQTLKVNPGKLSAKPAKVTYQWQRDGKNIKGATKNTYKLGLSDIGKKLNVVMTATGKGYNRTLYATSKTSSVAKAKFTVKKGATVSGQQKVGYKLTAKVGTWSPKPEKYKYQWYRSGAPISKATKSTYKMTSRDRNKVMYVKVTGSKKGYATKSITSSVK